jgi:Fe2+ transport system protein B
MSKNSSNSSVGSLDFSSYNLTKKEFSTSDIRMEELHEILIREEYRKYAIDNQIIEATDEFDEKAFAKVGLSISKNEETYNEISRRVSERILEIMKAEEFTEEELQELEHSQAVQKLKDEIDIQKSNESAIQKPFTNPTIGSVCVLFILIFGFNLNISST